MSKRCLVGFLARGGTKIVAVGKNYRKHVLEMGGKETPKEPVLFLKPTTSYVEQPHPIVIPQGIGEVHHELELGVVVGQTAKRVAAADAHQYIVGYLLALDMTARDLQWKAKAEGLPWTVSKGYDTFTPVSPLVPADSVTTTELDLWLDVNGERRQECNTGDMVHKIPDLVAHISRIMTLEPGDVILTGTPEGVGPVFPGDTVTAGIDGLVEVRFGVVAG